MRIIVYTIMKNELKNIESWLENIKDADGIYVLDTGSTDGSYEKMLEMKAIYPQLHIEQNIYDEFRFDTARNDNLSMVPNMDDVICWTIDLDERFCNDWYNKTKKAAEDNPGFYKLTYWYACRHDDYGNVTDKHIYDKCHQRIGASWSRPIHEILTYGDYENIYDKGNIMIDESQIFVHHYQNMETDRGPQYINLLKSRIESDKYDIEAMHHLTTEYTKLGDDQAQLDTLLLQYARGVNCKCDWLECICGNIAGYFEARDNADAEMWFKKAIDYNPNLITYYIRYSQYLSYRNRADEALRVLKSIPSTVYMQEEWKEIEGAHTWLLDDSYGLAYSWKGDYETALNCFRSAYERAIDANSDYGIEITSGHVHFCEDKLEKMIDKAYVTILSDNSYINGVVVLDRSLKCVDSKYPLYCIITEEVSEENRKVLSDLNIKIIEKDILIPKGQTEDNKVDVVESLLQSGWHKALVKLHIFGLNQFKKLVYIDSDVIVKQNIDDLFDKPHMTACWDRFGFSDQDICDSKSFNSGLLVIEPNFEEYISIINFFNNFESDGDLIHDQRVLQAYFKDWPDMYWLHLDAWWAPWTTAFNPDTDEYYYMQSKMKSMHIIDAKPWRVSKQYFYDLYETYPCYAKLCLEYIDILNYTINDLASKGIISSDLKIIN